MKAIITITHRYGRFNVSIIEDGKMKFQQDVMSGGAGAAAALALTYKARYKNAKIIGHDDVMKIINDF